MQQKFTFIDLFAGIGGFHTAAVRNGGECVFASEIDSHAQAAYFANYGIQPHGDITQIDASNIPDHDLLLGGFPCQPFSIIGKGQGFDDIRGTLFFDIVRILQAKRPQAFVLENVKRLASHHKGKTLARILDALDELGYNTSWKILNALDYGLPQKRERVILVGFLDHTINFFWPEKVAQYIPLAHLLEQTVDEKHFVSQRIYEKRHAVHQSQYQPGIWHENKSGNVASHPYSCALRAGASYNYLLVDGKRRLTPREMLRLQGFPDTFEIVCSDTQTRKQAGNAVPVPMIQAVIQEVLCTQTKTKKQQTQNKYRAVSVGRVSQLSYL